MMSRATSIYVVMLMVFIAGLWLILSFGSILLKAPEDLAGQWELYLPPSDESDEPVLTMRIEQSGRFFLITIGDHELDLKLVEQELTGRALDRVRLKLWGDKTSGLFEGRIGGDEFSVSLTGPLPGVWRAKRTAHVYPRTSTGQPARISMDPPTTSHAGL